MVVNKTKALGKNHYAIPIPNCVIEDSRDKLSHIEGIIVKKIKAAPSLSHPQSRRKGNHPWGVIPQKPWQCGFEGKVISTILTSGSMILDASYDAILTFEMRFLSQSPEP